MNCDYCFQKDATINDVCLPILQKSIGSTVPTEVLKICEFEKRRPERWGYCRLEDKKVQCCKNCPSFV